MIPGREVNIGEPTPAIFVRWKVTGVIAIVIANRGEGKLQSVTKRTLFELNGQEGGSFAQYGKNKKEEI